MYQSCTTALYPFYYICSKHQTIYIMKNILFLLLLIPVISFSQYSKKELKKLKKMELKIVNRGLDLNASFVPYSNGTYPSGAQWNNESDWVDAMFTLGLEVGDYSQERQVKDANNREMNLSNSLIFNGRYVFDVTNYDNFKGVIKIQDLNNNNKIVATISYRRDIRTSLKMEYVIRELIKSNK